MNSFFFALKLSTGVMTSKGVATMLFTIINNESTVSTGID